MAQKFGVTPVEYDRRDKIVKTLYDNCPYDKGDVCVPTNKEIAADLYGEIMVVGVAKNLADLGHAYEWPKTDAPLIVSFSASTQPGNTIICTTNFLQLKEKKS